MSDTNTDRTSGLHRLNGRLHSVHHLRDEAGEVIGTIVAFPVSFSATAVDFVK
jgi:hypothetical protein